MQDIRYLRYLYPAEVAKPDRKSSTSRTDNSLDCTERSITQSVNRFDQLCFARAIAVGMAHNEKETETDGPSYRKQAHPGGVEQGASHITTNRTAVEYQQLADVPTLRACSLHDIPKVRKAFNACIYVCTQWRGAYIHIH